MSCNKSGRPNNNTIKKFSQPPASMISILLKKIKGKECNLVPIDLDNEHTKECEQNNRESAHNLNIEFVDINQHHNNIKCQNWSNRSNTMKEHKKHLKIHKERQFSCDYPNCSYSSRLTSNLIKHKRVHTSEKPYLCDQCSFRSNFINSLKVHKRIHTNERPYSCTYCSYRCNSSSNLKKHCKHRHLDITRKL